MQHGFSQLPRRTVLSPPGCSNRKNATAQNAFSLASPKTCRWIEVGEIITRRLSRGTENSAKLVSSFCQTNDPCWISSGSFKFSSQLWRRFHSDWGNVFARSMNGAVKSIGSTIDAVRLMTFRRVSANSFGLNLNKKASFWTSQITPSALSVGKVPCSPMASHWLCSQFCRGCWH